MKKQKPLWFQKGFTLLELLLTVAILSLIVGIIGGAFRLAIRSWEKGEGKVEEFRKTRIILDKVAQQIKSFYPYWIKKEKKWMVAFQGEPQALTFVSPLSFRSPFITGLVLVQYFLEDDSDPDNGKNLVLRESRVIDEDSLQELLEGGGKDGLEVVLFSGLEDATFDYYVLPPDSEEGEWRKSWTGEDEEDEEDAEKIKLPQAIRITLKQKPKNQEEGEPLTTAMTVPLVTAPFKEISILNRKIKSAVSSGKETRRNPFGISPILSLPPKAPDQPLGKGTSTPFGPLPVPSGGSGGGARPSTPFGPRPAPSGGSSGGSHHSPFD